MWTRIALLLAVAVAPGSAATKPEPVRGDQVSLQGNLVDLVSGQALDLASLTKGRKTVLLLWTTWCGACTAEIPEMNALFDQFAGRQDLRFASICADNGLGARGPKGRTSMPKAAAHVRKYRIRYPALFDTPEAMVAGEFGEEGFPNLFLLDENGVVVASWNSEGGKDEFLAKARTELRLVPHPPAKR